MNLLIPMTIRQSQQWRALSDFKFSAVFPKGKFPDSRFVTLEIQKFCKLKWLNSILNQSLVLCFKQKSLLQELQMTSVKSSNVTVVAFEGASKPENFYEYTPTYCCINVLLILISSSSVSTLSEHIQRFS